MRKKHKEYELTEILQCKHCGKFYPMYYKRYYNRSRSRDEPNWYYDYYFGYIAFPDWARERWCDRCIEYYERRYYFSVDVIKRRCKYCGKFFWGSEEKKSISRFFDKEKWKSEEKNNSFGPTVKPFTYEIRYEVNETCGDIKCIAMLKKQREDKYMVNKLKKYRKEMVGVVKELRKALKG